MKAPRKKKRGLTLSKLMDIFPSSVDDRRAF